MRFDEAFTMNTTQIIANEKLLVISRLCFTTLLYPLQIYYSSLFTFFSHTLFVACFNIHCHICMYVVFPCCLFVIYTDFSQDRPFLSLASSQKIILCVCVCRMALCVLLLLVLLLLLLSSCHQFMKQENCHLYANTIFLLFLGSRERCQ